MLSWVKMAIGVKLGLHPQILESCCRMHCKLIVWDQSSYAGKLPMGLTETEAE